MKNLFFILLFVSFISNAQDLEEIRTEYPKAFENAEATNDLEGELAKVNSSSKSVLIAYKGAVSTVKAKFAKKKSEKMKFFKTGVSLIESTVKADPSNIEIRYIRMSVQENSPKFLGYHKNIEEDKGFILKNYTSVSSIELKQIIKKFIDESINFNGVEKKSIN